MKYIFPAYYTAAILKGKKRWLQITLAVLFVITPLIQIQSVINFLLGRPASITDLLYTVLLIYMIVNFLYAVLLPDSELKNKNVKNRSSPNVTIQNIEENKPHVILNTVHYTKASSIRTSPKKKLPLDTPPALLTKPILPKENENVPPLEINIESAEEFVQEDVETPDIEYSGVISEKFDFGQLDEIESEDPVVSDSQLPDPETALFDKVEKKKFI